MLIHIQSTHSYKTCGANDPGKNKIMRSAFLNAEEIGIKIHSLVVNRPSHTVYMIAESENFEDIHSEFIKMKGIGVIILDKKTTPLKVDPTKKIYESPDGGKTIYERDFGDHINKKKIK